MFGPLDSPCVYKYKGFDVCDRLSVSIRIRLVIGILAYTLESTPASSIPCFSSRSKSVFENLLPESVCA
jgi:hypothetical protein